MPTPADENVLSARIEHEWDEAIAGRDGHGLQWKLQGAGVSSCSDTVSRQFVHVEVKLSGDSILGAEHVETRFLSRAVDCGRLDVHTRPSLSEQLAELAESLRIVVPDVAEVP